MLCVFGGTCAGKSALLARLASDLTCTTVNPDLFKEALKGGDLERDDQVHEEAVGLALRTLGEAIAQRHHIAVDVIGRATPDGIKAQLEAMVSGGYRVEVSFAFANLAVARRRLVAREHEAGRYVPIEVFEAGHRAIPELFATLVQTAGLYSMQLFDCNEFPPQLVGRSDATGRWAGTELTAELLALPVYGPGRPI